MPEDRFHRPVNKINLITGYTEYLESYPEAKSHIQFTPYCVEPPNLGWVNGGCSITACRLGVK